MDIRKEILTNKQAAEDYLSKKRLLWDSAEQLFHNQLNDAISLEGNSQVFDPKLSTLTMERSYRVMSQLPVGKVKPISKNDVGCAKLMNLILDKYVLPNANAQWDFLTKMRMVDMYSNIYGNFFTLVDWDVRKNGYVGPDVWLLNIRDVFPQVGAVSLEDSDRIIIRTWRPLPFFEGLAKDKSYKNIPKIIERLKDKSGSKQNRDQQSTSKREDREFPDNGATKNGGYYEVLTQFERDRWVDYCTDADLEFRDINNPHDDDDLPVKCKYSIPLLDDFMGMGDFERGGSMQKAVNSIWNLYLSATKMSIFPPVLVNKDQIGNESSMIMKSAQKWLMRTGQGSVQGSVSPINLTPQGIATFNNVYQVANAAILNLFGTSDTSTTTATDPGFGRTPQALKMQTQRENTRDNADRFYMEQYLKSVMTKMVNLVSKRQSKAVTIRMFDEEIKEMERSYPEIKEMYNDKTGKLTIDKKKFGSILYDYEIVSGSTFATDQKSQQDNMATMMDMFLKAQRPDGGNTLEDMLKKDGYTLKFGELYKRIVSSAGIQDWDKILEQMTPEEHTDTILNKDGEQFQNIIQQMQTGGMNLNQVPAQPQTMPNVGGMPQ